MILLLMMLGEYRPSIELTEVSHNITMNGKLLPSYKFIYGRTKAKKLATPPVKRIWEGQVW